MQPPKELVFRETTSDDILDKLRAIGCVANVVDDPRLSKGMQRQDIELSLNNLRPFIAWLVWQDGSNETSFVYLPLDRPRALRDNVLSPILGIIDQFRSTRQSGPSAADSPFRQAGDAIINGLKSDPCFRESRIFVERARKSNRG